MAQENKPSFNVGPPEGGEGKGGFPQTEPFDPAEVEDQFEFVDGPVPEEEEEPVQESIQTPGSTQGDGVNPQVMEILDRLSRQTNIQTPGQPAQQNQQNQQSREEFNKMLEGKLYNGEIDEVVAMGASRMLGPVFEQMLGNVVSVKRDLLKAKNEEFMSKHEEEVEQEFKRMSPQERLDPEAYTKAFRRVKANYVDEEIEDRVAREVAKKLEEYGLGSPDGAPDGPGPAERGRAGGSLSARSPSAIASRGTAGVSSRNNGNRIRIAITQEDRREAKLYGMDPREVAMYRVMEEQNLGQV